MTEPKSEVRLVFVEKDIKTALGLATYIIIYNANDKKMGWDDVWKTFNHFCPNKWAIEIFPQKEKLINKLNRYHLYVFDGEIPAELDISKRYSDFL